MQARIRNIKFTKKDLLGDGVLKLWTSNMY